MSGCNILARLKKSGWSLQLILCVTFFASAAWVQINGIWVELPLIVAKSPQQWSLPSYLTIVIQIGNITPMLYLLVTKYVKCKKEDGGKILEIPTLYCILISELVLSFLLAFMWDRTSEINGDHYSTWLIAINFLIAGADALSSVTFLPFMAYFPQMYMVVFYIGAGMSGFLPSIAALVQGLGPTKYTCQKSSTYERDFTPTFINTTNFLVDVANSNNNGTSYDNNQFQPRFSVKIFFFLLTGLLLLSLVAFVFLVRIKNKLTSEKHSDMTSESNNRTTELGRNNQTYTNDVNDGGNSNDISLDDVKSKTEPQNDDVKIDQVEGVESKKSNENTDEQKSEPRLSRNTIGLFLFINCVINGLSNGILPAVQSYACLPYGSDIYHLTLTLSSAVNPIACFLYFFISIKKARFIFIGFLLYLTSSAYTIAIASYSPCPLLNGSSAGGVVVVSR